MYCGARRGISRGVSPSTIPNSRSELRERFRLTSEYMAYWENGQCSRSATMSRRELLVINAIRAVTSQTRDGLTIVRGIRRTAEVGVPRVLKGGGAPVPSSQARYPWVAAF